MIKEVEKFLHCGDLSNGFRVFKCEACPNVIESPIRCKGKFCSTCAVGEAQKWAEIQANDMYHAVYRHVVLTIDEGLRPIFAEGKSWRERIKEIFDRDPLECSECGNYLELKGIAVRKNSRLEVAFANDKEAKQYIRREIRNIESKTYQLEKKEATIEAVKNIGTAGMNSPKQSNATHIEFICQKCKVTENIPRDVVEHLDFMDGRDPMNPPRFICEHWEEAMVLVYYKGL